MTRYGLTRGEATKMLEKESDLQVGDKVKIDYVNMAKRKDLYAKDYYDFIEKHKDVVFTLAKDEKYPGDNGIFVFAETTDENSPEYMETPWLWYFMDLIKVGE